MTARDRQHEHADGILSLRKSADRRSGPADPDRHLPLHGLPTGKRFAFTYFAVWPADSFESKGDTTEFAWPSVLPRMWVSDVFRRRE
jgi:hypothetical protein